MSQAGVQEETQAQDTATPAAATLEAPAALPPTAAFASAIGNRAMARMAAGSSGTAIASPRSREGMILSRALGDTAPHQRDARDLLSRAVVAAESNPGLGAHLARSSQPARCPCGGTIMSGGECSKCMQSRLMRQGMDKREAQRVVLARTKASTRTLARTRSFMGCLNAHLASFGVGWATITILGGICGILGALAGMATGPAAPAAAPSGMAVAAAVCIAAVTGLAIGTVLGFIQFCWSTPDQTHPATSTE